MKLLNIIKRYGNDHEVLKDISLELDNCGLVSILGPSGSGKSTLLNIAGMLDPDYEGAVVYSDKPVGKSESEMRKLRAERIGFVFQEYNLINSISVKENILTSLYLVGSDFAKTKYTEVMSRFGLTDLQDRLPGTLSGGEKQRVAIVRALIRGSSVILADEPTGNLDEANAEGVFEALTRPDHLFSWFRVRMPI